jgi:hypothetical protein
MDILRVMVKNFVFDIFNVMDSRWHSKNLCTKILDYLIIIIYLLAFRYILRTCSTFSSETFN